MGLSDKTGTETSHDGNLAAGRDGIQSIDAFVKHALCAKEIRQNVQASSILQISSRRVNLLHVTSVDLSFASVGIVVRSKRTSPTAEQLNKAYMHNRHLFSFACSTNI